MGTIIYERFSTFVFRIPVGDLFGNATKKIIFASTQNLFNSFYEVSSETRLNLFDVISVICLMDTRTESTR